MDMNAILVLALYNGHSIRDNDNSQCREIVGTNGNMIKSWTKQQVDATPDVMWFGFFKAPTL